MRRGTRRRVTGFSHLHVLDALYGGGDADGDGRVTAAEAKRYLDRHMTRAARRQHRRIQEASLVGVADAVLAAAAGGAFPARPGSEASTEAAALPASGDGRAGKKVVARTEGPSPSAEAAESMESAAKREREGSKPGRKFRDCEDCPELVVVPGGSHEMGSPLGEAGRNDDEGPLHRVRISEPFAVGVYEVTFREWDECRRAGGCSHNPGGRGWGRDEERPVNRCELGGREGVRSLAVG